MSIDPPTPPLIARERRLRAVWNMAGVRTLVRPLVTLVFAIGVVAGFFDGRLTGEQFLSVAMLVINFWFVARTVEKSKEG